MVTLRWLWLRPPLGTIINDIAASDFFDGGNMLFLVFPEREQVLVGNVLIPSKDEAFFPWNSLPDVVLVDFMANLTRDSEEEWTMIQLCGWPLSQILLFGFISAMDR